MLYATLGTTTQKLILEFDQIPSARKETLKELAKLIQEKSAHQKIYLNFICTHNSRRSHVAQLWAQVAAYYYTIADVECLSGGTEATAFNPRAVKAMQLAGFDITKTTDGDNPLYEVRYAMDAIAVMAFSKTYNDPFNHHDFTAIMTCSQADDNCPVVIGATKRIAITYDDPKAFDDTPQETEKYAERVNQIGREMLYAFSQVVVENNQQLVA